MSLLLSPEQYKSLEVGWEYQDFVTQKLFEYGIVVNAYQSRKFQMENGESISGIEIKNDRNMAKTGNIYIEYAQKTMRGSSKESGIRQKDKSWLYAIGDYEHIYLFAKSQLQHLLSKVKDKEREYAAKFGITLRTTKNEDGDITSYGLVIPVNYVVERNLFVLKIDCKGG